VRARALAAVAMLLAAPVLAFDPVALPPELAGYRSWWTATAAPYAVPEHVAALCAPAPPERAGDTVQRAVYANEAARPALASAARSVAAGAVIAKEKLARADESEPAAVAFMVRREAASFRETGGWEFLFYPPPRDAEATHQACAACHRSAGDGDYVFGHGSGS
jgi:hypothetical protein